MPALGLSSIYDNIRPSNKVRSIFLNDFDLCLPYNESSHSKKVNEVETKRSKTFTSATTLKKIRAQNNV